MEGRGGRLLSGGNIRSGWRDNVVLADSVWTPKQQNETAEPKADKTIVIHLIFTV